MFFKHAYIVRNTTRGEIWGKVIHHAFIMICKFKRKKVKGVNCLKNTWTTMRWTSFHSRGTWSRSQHFNNLHSTVVKNKHWPPFFCSFWVFAKCLLNSQRVSRCFNTQMRFLIISSVFEEWTEKLRSYLERWVTAGEFSKPNIFLRQVEVFFKIKNKTSFNLTFQFYFSSIYKPKYQRKMSFS